MGIFDKLFAKKQPPAVRAAEQPPEAPAPAAPQGDTGAMIQAFDAFGRPILISAEDWRTNVLKGSLHAHWDNPDGLYDLIIGALESGFHADVLEAAARLHGIDSMPERGATVLAIVLMRNGALNEAESVLTSYTQQHGESGVILTNLAKVYAERDETQRADDMLWRALQLDPNLDNAVGWYMAIHHERGGEEAGLEAMRCVASLPGSWRAQLWLARAALSSGNHAQALALYNESLSRTEGDTPDLLLKQMSGDLGTHGLLRELVELTAPRFDVGRHGEMVGNNLIKAYLDLDQPDAARQVLELLHAARRPDWDPVLSFWEQEIARAKLAPVELPADGHIPLSMLQVAGPVWKPAEPVPGLLPSGDATGPVVCFLGSTAEHAAQAEQGQQIQNQLTDEAGRLSRALPLFLAEQAHLTTTARAHTLVPWVALQAGTFALNGRAWSDEEAAQYAGPGNDYVVVTHLRAIRDPWNVQLRLVRTRDAACVATLGAALDSQSPAEGIRRLADRLVALLREKASAEACTPPPLYTLPPGNTLSDYLVRLEQLLAIRCFSMEGADPTALSGTREMIAGNLQLCLDNPRNAATRLLLVQTVRGLRKAHENAVRDFADRVALLQRAHPLPHEVHDVMQRLLDDPLAP